MKAIIKKFVSPAIYHVPDVLVSSFFRARMERMLERHDVIERYVESWETDAYLKASRATYGLMESGINFPTHSLTKKPTIYAMIGLPQTGKSQIADSFGEAVGAVVIEINKLRAYLHHKKVKNFSFFNEAEFYMATVALYNGHSVVMDSDYASPIKRRALEVFASENNADVQYLRVECSKEVWRKRINSKEYCFPPLYYDAVVGDMKVSDHPFVGEFHQKLVEYLEKKYTQQEIEHRSLPQGVISFVNDGSLFVVKYTARLQAYDLLGARGATEAIRNYFKIIHERGVRV